MERMSPDSRLVPPLCANSVYTMAWRIHTVMWRVWFTSDLATRLRLQLFMLLSVARHKIDLNKFVSESQAANKAMPIPDIETLWPVTAASVLKFRIHADLVLS